MMKSWFPTSGTIRKLLGHKSIDFIKELAHWWIHNNGLAIRRWGTWITAGKLLKVVFYSWPVCYSSFFDSLSNSWFPMSLVALLQQTIALWCIPAPAQEKGCQLIKDWNDETQQLFLLLKLFASGVLWQQQKVNKSLWSKAVSLEL